MIRLSFYDQEWSPAAQCEITDLRITGGTISHHEPPGVIAHYSGGAWNYLGKLYPILTAEGLCRLHFGITRDPLPVSEQISVFTLTGATLRANGVPFAQYVEDKEMWQGLMRPLWWQSLRIVTDLSAPLAGDESSVPLFNPWDPRVEGPPSAMDLRGM
jgi:hypothetical protein